MMRLSPTSEAWPNSSSISSSLMGFFFSAGGSALLLNLTAKVELSLWKFVAAPAGPRVCPREFSNRCSSLMATGSLAAVAVWNKSQSSILAGESPGEVYGGFFTLRWNRLLLSTVFIVTFLSTASASPWRSSKAREKDSSLRIGTFSSSWFAPWPAAWYPSSIFRLLTWIGLDALVSNAWLKSLLIVSPSFGAFAWPLFCDFSRFETFCIADVESFLGLEVDWSKVGSTSIWAPSTKKLSWAL